MACTYAVAGSGWPRSDGSNASHSVLGFARLRARRTYQPLESSQGAPVGPVTASTPAFRSIFMPGQTASRSPRKSEGGRWSKPRFRKRRTSKPGTGSAESVARAARPEAWAVAAARRRSAVPDTQPTTESPRCRAAAINGARARWWSSSPADPSAHVTTRQLTGVPATSSRARGSHHCESASASRAVMNAFGWPACRSRCGCRCA